MKKIRKIGKKVAAGLMAMMLCISSISLNAFTTEAATIQYSGTDGDLSWSIDSDGHLLVEGSGDCASSSPAWLTYSTLVNTATVSVTNSTNLNYWFSGCTNLTSVDLSALNTSNVTSMNGMFIRCSELTSIDLSNFNTSKVTDMAQMFFGCSKLTQLDLSNFDTSNVTKTFAMFYECTSLMSLDLSTWDMSNVISVANMFYNCTQLQRIKTPLNVNCDVSLTNMGPGVWQDEEENIYSVLPLKLSKSIELHYNGDIMAILYSGTDGGLTWTIDSVGHLSVTGSGDYTESYPGWYSYRTKIMSAKIAVDNVTNLSKYFYKCTNLKTVDFTDTDTAGVTDMSYLFAGCSELPSLDLSSIDTSNVTNMSGMFSGCDALTSLDLSSIDASNVTNMSGMFSGCSGLTSLDLNSIDTSSVITMSEMFRSCYGLTNLNLSGFDTSSVIDMSRMFCECEKITSLDLSSFDTSNVTNMLSMFEVCSQLEEVDLSSFDTSKVVNMGSMFMCCGELTELDLSHFDTSNVTDMSMMFMQCSKLTRLDLSSFNTTKMTQMISVFEYCNQLKELDLSSFDMSNVTQEWHMFSCCPALIKINAPMNVDIDIELPTNEVGDWENSAGEVYTHLPKATNSSITLYCGGVEHEKVAGYTISLNGDIAVNFHMHLSDEVLNDSTAYMKFTFADGEVSKVYVSDAKVDGEYYIFTCNVQAPEMNDEFTAQLITNVTNTTEEYTYSVKKYADYILKHATESDDYAKAAPMVKAMLNYGGYSQLQFNHNTDALANEGLYTTETESDPVLTETITISDDYSLPVPSEDIGLQYYGSSLLLNSETTLRHYFTISGDEDIATIREKYTFVLKDGTALTPTLYKGMVCVDIKNINAAELDDIFTIAVTNTESGETFSLSYSAFSYAKYVLEYSLARENLVNVIKAMYLYNAAANEYFG